MVLSFRSLSDCILVAAQQLKYTFLNFQPKPKKGKKKIASAPILTKKAEAKKVVNPLFEKTPKNFGIGKFISVCVGLIFCSLLKAVCPVF